MNRTLNEAKALRQLNIPDFRHMTRDKVVDFVSILPRMDPEVAKRALEQFPAFSEAGLAIVGCLKDSLKIAADSNAANMSEFNAQCGEALNALETLLAREDLTDEGRKQVIDCIMGIIDAMGRKDAENKAFLAGLFRDVLTGSGVVMLCLSMALGLSFNSSNGR